MSYRKTHIKKRVSKTKPKKSILKKKWFWIILALIVVCLIISWISLFYEGLQVKTVSVNGNSKIDAQTIRKTVIDNSEFEFFRIFGFKVATSSIFLANTKKIEAKIARDFPEIENLKVSKILPQTIKIEVSERQTVGILCNNNGSENQQCFLVDKGGIVFEETQLKDDMMKIYEYSNTIYTVGEQAIKTELMNEVYSIKKLMNDGCKIDIEEVFLKDGNRLDIKTKEGWEVYFESGSAYKVNKQILKLDMLLKRDIPEEDRGSLRYIDLRADDRAIICDNDICG